MGQKSDVKVDVSPLPGVTVVGISLNFTAGAIPTALIDVAPGSKSVIKVGSTSPRGSGNSQGILANPDKFKRKEEIKVKIEVKSQSGSAGDKTRTLEWTGLLDGLTIGNTVGQNTYQAVLKGKAQTLLELTIATPGLHPTSINPYRNPLYSIIGNANAGDKDSEVAWASIPWSEEMDFSENPIKFYTKAIKNIIKLQKENYQQYLGNETTVDSQIAIQQILDEKRYKKALEKAEKIWDKIDTNAVETGSITNLRSSSPNASSTLKNYLLAGPNVLLENYLNFLTFMGCTMIFGGDDKSWVVPERSFIKQTHSVPGQKKTSSTTNVAHPADYNGYTYNDNGYRDIFAVIVASEIPIGGATVLNIDKEPGYIGWYYDKQELTEASGLLIIKNHPFSFYYALNDNNYVDAKELKNIADGASDYYPADKQWGAKPTVNDQKKRNEEKRDNYEDNLGGSDVLNNYAETKFYQGRYGDRRGTITMEFNPKWCPGTGGTLYVRETGFFVDFWVESVTHRIDMTPPTGGSAITVVNFCCGRMGASPVGTDADKFLGYDKGKEKGVQEAFVADIKGT
jgi:hypothetical protein